MKNLFLATLTFALALSMFAMSVPVQASSLPVGGQTFTLAGAGITAVQNTIQLSSFDTPDGRAITMSNFGTVGYGALEPQTSSRIEDVSFTGITQNTNGTATLTGVTRGVDFLYPYGSQSFLEKAHSGGATFIITNTAQFYYNEFAMMNNSNDFTWPTASSSIATKGYVDGVAFGGILPQASLVAQGVVQFPTGAQIAASVANGSAGPLAISANLATSTYNAATAVNVIPVTGGGGHIDSNFLSIATSSPIYAGNPIYQSFLYRQIITGTGTTTFAVPAGVTSAYVQLVSAGSNGGGSNGCSASGDACSGAGGAAGGYASGVVNLTGTSTVQVYVGTSSLWTTFGTNGSFMYATGATNASTQTPGIGGSGVIVASTTGSSVAVGQGGQGGFATTAYLPSSGWSSGAGGSSLLGGGAPSATQVSTGNSAGVSGGNYGGGGSGGVSVNSASAGAGTGAQGEIIVWW